MSRKRLRVLIAEDNPDVREALSELISHEPMFLLVGAVANATDAIELAAARQPDVALLDVRMPGGGGRAAAEGITLCSPGCQLIALSEHDDAPSVREMLQAGAMGYLVKGGPNTEIVQAIKSAADGKGTLSRDVTSGIVQALSQHLRSGSQTSERRRSTKRRIRDVIRDEHAFAMAFQPIVELRSSAIVGVEALARFVGPPRRAPDLWFSEAASVGFGTELELAAIRKACATLPRLPRDVYLSINLSPETLATAELYELIAEVGGTSLVAEITEHALVESYESVTGAVGRLRALGVRLAVDDAGAGFASFRHILNLSPELIKLDLTLIRDIHLDGSKRALTSGLISFADKSGALIVAEGIESAPELETLVELGILYGQGYLLGRPSPLPVI